jgi:hypothetical protein
MRGGHPSYDLTRSDRKSVRDAVLEEEQQALVIHAKAIRHDEAGSA